MPAPKKNPLTKLVKASKKINKFKSSMFDPEDAMPPYEYNKGRLIDMASGKSKKVKVKNLNKVIKKESPKNIERLYKNKILKKTKTSMPVKKNTTVKKRSK